MIKKRNYNKTVNTTEKEKAKEKEKKKTIFHHLSNDTMIEIVVCLRRAKRTSTGINGQHCDSKEANKK